MTTLRDILRGFRPVDGEVLRVAGTEVIAGAEAGVGVAPAVDEVPAEATFFLGASSGPFTGGASLTGATPTAGAFTTASDTPTTPAFTTASDTPFAAIDPRRLRVEVAVGAAVRLVVLHTRVGMSQLDIVAGEGAWIELTELFVAEAFAELTITQAAHSTCRTTLVQFSSANIACRIDLEGPQAENTLGGVFLAGDAEHCEVHLQTNHHAPDCRSNSSVRGVAGGTALGEFVGKVYVAPDAQHTDARQQSRNILLGEGARIRTEPQLEIYADDVKCTHGATVGQVDTEAILYMRQRGLSEVQARRLQIEGFVGEVVRGCGIEPLCDALMQAVADKMERM